MAETPQFYMPDLKMMWKPMSFTTSWATDQVRYLGGRRQRRGRQNQKIRSYKLMNANALKQEDRRAFYDFFNLMQGGLKSFYFWETSPRSFINVAPGWVYGTNGSGDVSRASVPYKGAYWLGDTPIAAQYNLTPSQNNAQWLFTPATGLTAATQITSLMSCPPRGNRYATYLFRSNGMYGQANGANVAIAGSQTLAAWVFLRPLDGQTYWSIFFIGNATNTGLMFSVNSSRQVQFQTFGTSSTTLASTATVPLNTWTHVAVTLSGATATLYINGVQVAQAGGMATPGAPAQPFYVGQAGGIYFHGMINDLKIFSQALSASIIQDLYNGITTYDQAGSQCQLNLPMTDGKTATTFTDAGPNGYNVSIIGATDDSWVGGEDELDVYSSSLSGNALFLKRIDNARQRVVVTFANDDLPESFLADVVPVDANFDIQLVEAV